MTDRDLTDHSPGDHSPGDRDLTDRDPGARPPVTGERADWLAALAKQRHLLRFTTRDLTDDAARRRTTASELCLGGLVKHVTEVERAWADFILNGPSGMPDFTAMTDADWARRAEGFRLLPGETLAGVLADYAAAARRTDELVATIPDLDATRLLPKSPWTEPGARWSARQVLLHIVSETAQHAGHADIIRESLDGAKSMG
ncbi:DinB family protein [Streptomyces corynorhini]|uniref:DinB family protein n=1 Tax=Streptomyces corynorhini TaxID=2282652 RepID=A0A370BB35_9ACTN|nr:DinB family protein [Streptomyces corynorhini]RDG37589.1 DinB family protein [Streptomyces corynorhini]